jgi:anaphase-promoting complex subunit 3
MESASSDAAKWDVKQQHLLEQQAVDEADAYILELIRIFAKAIQAMGKFRCQDVIDQLELLPEEQQYSATVMTLLGRAFFEKLDYIRVRYNRPSV